MASQVAEDIIRAGSQVDTPAAQRVADAIAAGGTIPAANKVNQANTAGNALVQVLLTGTATGGVGGNGAPGDDLTAQEIWKAPGACTVTAARFVPLGPSSGVDGSNTVVLALKNGSTSVATLTRTTDFVQGTGVALTLSGTAANLNLAAGDTLTLDMTCGATAQTNAGLVLVSYYLRGA